MNPSQTILVIDDDPSIQRLIKVLLKEHQITLLEAECAADGLAIAEHAEPDLILLDVNLPDRSGFEVCRKLKASDRLNDIPIIFLTGSDQVDEKVRGFQLGAVDYVTKPFNAAELRARVSAALRMQRLVDMLEEQALRDPLTGLPNRQAYSHALQTAIERSRLDDKFSFAVLFLDLDRFKLINDSLGHEAGDALLIDLATIIRTSVRGTRGVEGSGDIVARMGGDEFTVLLNDLGRREDAEAVAQRIINDVAQSMQISGFTITPNVSVGIRHSDSDTDSVESVIRDSDTAMYKAKATGRGTYVVFDHAMHQAVLAQLQLENDFAEGLADDQFALHYQPFISLDTGQVLGFEALIRWRHPERGLIPPGQFIPIAEDSNYIQQIGTWVLNAACRQITEWQEQFDLPAGFRVGVNLSKRQLGRPDIVDTVGQILEAHAVDPAMLDFEVTESVIMCNMDLVMPNLKALRDLGCTISLDDFGTGVSSLASLHLFPVRRLKIDRSFIKSMTERRNYATIVQAIVNLAHNLDLPVIAEGVETQQQLLQCQTLECDEAQGFLFAKPMPAEEAAKLLARGDQPLEQIGVELLG